MVLMALLFGEPDRDPRLGDALRHIEGTPPDEGEGLRQRIMDAARPVLAGLRTAGRPWWAWLSAWVRVAVPVSVAASLAAALFLPGRADIVGGDSSSAIVGADSTIVLAAFSDPGTGGQLTAHLIAPEAGDWLLAQAFDQ
jgi:hypothetical protein